MIMDTRILLVVPKRFDCINELKRFINWEEADIYVFPEGFLDSEHLGEALEIIRDDGKFVISGYDDKSGKEPMEKALVIDRGEIIGETAKCILTPGEKKNGYVPGSDFHCVDTRFGKIAIPICYEIHFPEVSRILAYEDPVLFVNTVGTSMWHELQFEQWTALGRARAIENEVHIVGCCHYTEGIAMAYCYDCDGRNILTAKNSYGAFLVKLDLEKSHEKKIGYFKDRMPALFGKITKEV